MPMVTPQIAEMPRIHGIALVILSLIWLNFIWGKFRRSYPLSQLQCWLTISFKAKKSKLQALYFYSCQQRTDYIQRPLFMPPPPPAKHCGNTYAGLWRGLKSFASPAASQCVMGTLKWTRREHSCRCQAKRKATPLLSGLHSSEILLPGSGYQFPLPEICKYLSPSFSRSAGSSVIVS